MYYQKLITSIVLLKIILPSKTFTVWTNTVPILNATDKLFFMLVSTSHVFFTIFEFVFTFYLNLLFKPCGKNSSKLAVFSNAKYILLNFKMPYCQI